jgi:hypothetical protein
LTLLAGGRMDHSTAEPADVLVIDDAGDARPIGEARA